MKLTLAAALCFLALGCSTTSPECPPCAQAQAVSAESLVGLWRAGRGNSTLSIQLNGDGTLLIGARNYPLWAGYGYMQQSGTASGRWSLEGERFKGYVEASDLLHFKRGYQWIDEVVLVSDTDLILRNESGNIEGYRRQSPAD